MLIGLDEDKTSIDFGFPRSMVQVTRVTIVKKNVNMVFAHDLEKYLSQSFHTYKSC